MIFCISNNRYPELLKPPDTSESLYSDRNSSYDNVEKRNVEREEAGDSRKDQIYDSSEWETPLETDESDVERMKRNKSFKERLDPLLCEFAFVFYIPLRKKKKCEKSETRYRIIIHCALLSSFYEINPSVSNNSKFRYNYLIQLKIFEIPHEQIKHSGARM